MEARGDTIREMVNATKVRYGADALDEVLDGVRHLVVAKGKKVLRFDLKKDEPTDAELAKVMLGPTGNLRAPTVRMGQRMVVGFNEEAFE